MVIAGVFFFTRHTNMLVVNVRSYFIAIKELMELMLPNMIEQQGQHLLFFLTPNQTVYMKHCLSTLDNDYVELTFLIEGNE